MKSMAQEDWSAGAVFTTKKGEIVSRTDQESEQTAFSANEKNFQKLLRKLISFPVTKSL